MAAAPIDPGAAATSHRAARILLPVPTAAVPLTSALAAVLLRSAPALAVHWLDRIAAALPRVEATDASIDAPEVRFERAERVIDAAVRALGAATTGVPNETTSGTPIGTGHGTTGTGADALTLAGWEYGVAAHLQGRALHDLSQEFDLLLAILLHESEQAVTREALLPDPAVPDAAAPSAAAAFLASRRLHEAVALASLAASAGHAQETMAALRLRFRTLRHDLRNPLSTIQNVVSMMEDASMPAETRHDPRYTGMLQRNAEALGELIARELGEGGVGAGAGVRAVSIGAVALAVRRSLRAELRAADADIETDPRLPIALIDATSVALALRALFAAALRRVGPGTTLRLLALPSEAPADGAATQGGGFGTRRNRRPRPMLRLAVEGPFNGDPDAAPSPESPGDGTDQASSGASAPPFFDSALEVATRVGGTVRFADGRLLLELPMDTVDDSAGTLA